MTVSEKLRLVQGLHSHAEMFGFNWDDGSDWTWHDVACKIADEIEAENAKLRERIHELEMEGSDHFYRTAYAEDANRTLEAENAKLRELLQDVAICACGRYCHGCPHQYDGCDRDERLRELGIEVDG